MRTKAPRSTIKAKPQARAAAIKAVQEHLARRGIAARVERTEHEDFHRIRYRLPAEPPRVSIIIPTRDLLERLQPCVDSSSRARPIRISRSF